MKNTVTRNPGGRPETVGGRIVNVKYGQDRLDRVDALARELGLTRSETLRYLIDEALDARERRAKRKTK